MWRYLVGGLAALLLVAAGVFLFKGSAIADHGLPAAPQAAVSGTTPALPDAAPAATERTREQKRFDRYDKDRNGQVSRDEYLAARHKAFAKLDVDHDGKLAFEEWAAKAIAKFGDADKDKSGAMTAAEFATTAAKRSARPRCACSPAKPEEPARTEED